MAVTESFIRTGVADKDMVAEKFPCIDRINKGPVAVVECYMCIPCNPCETACKFKAITIGSDINNMPVVDFDKCVGCGMCISKCPGLSIMVVDGSANTDNVQMRLPYEFLPLPKSGDTVNALDRAGSFVTTAKVVNVANPASFDKTPVVTLEFDRKYLYDVRNFTTKRTEER